MNLFSLTLKALVELGQHFVNPLMSLTTAKGISNKMLKHIVGRVPVHK